VRVSTLRIAINAQLKPDASAGGVRRVVAGLIRGLGELTDGPEEYVIITSGRGAEWVRPMLGPNQALAIVPDSNVHLGRRAAVARSLRLFVRSPSRSLRLASLVAESVRDRHSVPISAGFYESLRCDAIHFPYQQFIRTALPSVYNPHDLQHRHFPDNFEESARQWRDATFRVGFREAHTIVVSSQWVRQDIVRHYGVDPARIEIIPWGVGTGYDEAPSRARLEDVKRRYELPEAFIFYPAVAWPHKNHCRLIEAVAQLRDRRGLRVNLICTGGNGAAMGEIRAAISRLAIDDQVRVLGSLPPEDMRPLFRLAQFVVIPTLFEASSGPAREAWFEGRAVACSAVTSLPEQVGDAGLLFDPYSIEDIAEAIRRLSADASLRERLAQRGVAKLKGLRWGRIARAYRSVYRRAARFAAVDGDAGRIGSGRGDAAALRGNT
jgi:glycosyltransferase involved in cell wall biosynthesis